MVQTRFDRGYIFELKKLIKIDRNFNCPTEAK